MVECDKPHEKIHTQVGRQCSKKYSKKKKMAAMTAMSVVVVEGELSALHSMGFPLPVLATLQEAKLHLQMLAGI